MMQFFQRKNTVFCRKNILNIYIKIVKYGYKPNVVLVIYLLKCANLGRMRINYNFLPKILENFFEN